MQRKEYAQYHEQVIEIYQKTGLSGTRISGMGIFPVDRTTIIRWIAKFAKESNPITPTEMAKSIASKAKELEDLKAQVADLEEQLRVERLRNRLNEKIIDIAEKRWNIEIRKKAGTKQ